MKILVINGPNLNLLGIREPALYGKLNYTGLCEQIQAWAQALAIDVELFQSNHEGAIVDKIQEAYFQSIDGIVMNPAAYTHTSVAILDALKATQIPTVEVHISDIHTRETFRHFSYVSLAALHQITGHGTDGYHEALVWLVEWLSTHKKCSAPRIN